jgi:hypothetical protein
MAAAEVLAIAFEPTHTAGPVGSARAEVEELLAVSTFWGMEVETRLASVEPEEPRLIPTAATAKDTWTPGAMEIQMVRGVAGLRVESISISRAPSVCASA